MSTYSFSFEVDGFDENLFTLQRFNGNEALSCLFYFDVELKCLDLNLESKQLLNKSAKLTIFLNQKAIRTVKGIINLFEDTYYYSNAVLYKARLVPHAWALTKFESNEVYLDQTISETLSCILDEIGLSSTQYRFDFNKEYRKWPFRLQYSESHFNFLQRLIEREGIYYYFDSTKENDVLVFTDNIASIQPAQTTPLLFQPLSSVKVSDDVGFISSFICKQQSLPQKIVLRDFNESLPSLDVRGEIEVDSTGMGEINLYGLNILTPEEGEALCQVHANSYLCRQEQFIAASELALMAPGVSFKLQDHPKASYNQHTYILESISHSGVNVSVDEGNNETNASTAAYENSLIAYSSIHEYAPQRTTKKPEINGTLNGIIDSETDGEYAELDEFGRYKIKLPFDRRDRDGGKASHWIRMMQPYGGTKEGMHFPLRKGTRVLLSFIGGDPDKPVIAGTITDLGEQSSLVNSQNATNSMIRTAAGNKIEIEDKEGRNRIKFECPTNNTYMHLGAPNHDGSGYVLITEGIERKDIQGGQRLTIQVLSENPTHTFSESDQSTATDYSDIQEFKVLDHAGMVIETMTTDMEIEGSYLVERRCGPKYLFTDGNEHVYGGGDVYGFGNGYEESHWREADDGGVHPDEVFKILGDDGEVFVEEDGQYSRDYQKKIDGAIRFDPGNHQIEKVWSDTFSYQNGNNYTWGDTCDYEFGNGYAESHVDTNDDGSPVNPLNKKDWPFDLAIPQVSDENPHLVAVGAINGVYVKLDGGNTGVEKSIGNAYEYSHGNSLAVSYACDEEEHSYGGEKYEATYTKEGKLVGSEHKKNGVCTEIEQTPDGDFKEETISDVSGVGKVTTTNVYAYGAPVSYEIVREPAPGSTFSFKGDGLPTIEMKMEIDVGATEIATHIGGMSNKVEMEALGMKNEITISGAIMSNTIELSGCPLETEIKTGDDGLEIKAWIGPLKTIMETRALELETKQALELKTKTLEIISNQLQLASTNAQLTNSQVRLANSLITLIS